MIRKGMFISNRYEILGKVGSGGMSDVYKAKDHKLNRFVAIKVLKQDYSEDKNFVSKFRVEAQNAAGLMHNNIVNVYDVGEEQGVYFIVMELIEGITLKQYIARKGKLSVREAISIGIQIAQGIECAHNNQIIHRDIKPQNIIISRDGKVKVTDFGIARAASVNTHTTNAMGSVHYMSPEQAKGSMVDAKSDIYSLGITMYEMLTGHVPFDGESTVTIALQHIKKQVPSVREDIADIPISIEKIVLKCTQNRPERRYLKISSLISDMKKALIDPDTDFVQLDDDSDANGTTVMITPDEMKVIRTGADNEDEKAKDTKATNDFDLDDDDDDSNEEGDPFNDEGNSRMEKIITIGGVVVVIIVVIGAIIGITNLFNGSFAALPGVGQQETVDSLHSIVPNLLGKNEDEAAEALHEVNLGIKYQYDYNDEYTRGYVCAQSDLEGNVVDKNTTIIVTISNGPERVELPSDIVGSTVESAIQNLETAGFKWKLIYEYSAKKIGTVINTDPNDIGEVAKGETITLTVSRGLEGKTDGLNLVSVPNVLGQKKDKALTSLAETGIAVNNTIQVYSNTVAKGKVIRLTVKPGVSLPYGSSVGMVVSLGAEEDTTQEPTTIEQTTVEITTEAPTIEQTTEDPSQGQASYQGSYTFAVEELKDINGSPVTSGVIAVFVNGVAQAVDPTYARVENWPGDYVFNYSGSEPGSVELQLSVDGTTIVTTTMTLQ